MNVTNVSELIVKAETLIFFIFCMSNEKGLDKTFVRFVSYLVLTCGFFLMIYIM